MISTAVCSAFSFEILLFSVKNVESLVVLFSRKPSSFVSDSLPDQFIIGNFYVRPLPDEVSFDELFFALEGLRLEYDCPFVLLGDFNAHLSHPEVTAVPTRRDADFQEFMLRLDSSGFSYAPDETNRFPTFVGPRGSSFIDFMFISGVGWRDFSVSVQKVHGHRSLECEVDLPAPVPVPTVPRHSFRKHL